MYLKHSLNNKSKIVCIKYTGKFGAGVFKDINKVTESYLFCFFLVY